MSESERVWCIPRSILPKDWLRAWTALPLTVADLTRALLPDSFHCLPRSIAERDAAYKQVIPYGVLRDFHSHRIACYQRSGSEERLHGLWSIGIGGHLNASDGENITGLMEFLRGGLQRETREELGQYCPEPRLIGIINEEKTDVGRVHLGVVFLIDIDATGNFLPGRELQQFGWKPPSTLLTLRLEYWSRLALKLVADSSDINKDTGRHP